VPVGHLQDQRDLRGRARRVTPWCEGPDNATVEIPTTPLELRAALSAGDHEAVVLAFAELEFLETCCRGSVAALIAELAYVVREAPAPLPAGTHVDHPSGARLDPEILALLGAILEGSRDALARAPDRLFPILYAELYWRDLDAPDHPGRQGSPDPGDASSSPDGRRLWRWAEHLRATFEARPAACWLRPLRPPETLTLVSWRLPGEPRALCADGRVLLVSRDSPGYESGGPWRLPVPPPAAMAQPLEAGGARFVACSQGTARLFAADALAPLRVLGRRERAAERAVFLASGRLVLTASRTELDLFSAEDGACLASFTSPVAAQAIPFDDGPVLLHHEAGDTLWCLDRAFPLGTTGPLAARLTMRDGERRREYRLNARAFADERCLLDARTGHAVLTIASPRSPGISISPDGACFAVFWDEHVQLWSTETLAPYATLTPHDRAVQRAVFSRDAHVVFTEAISVVRASRVTDGACLASRTIDGEPYIGGLLPCADGSVLVHDGRRWLLWAYREDRLVPIGDGAYVTAQWSAVSPSGDRLITAEASGASCCGWSLPDGQLRFRERLPEELTSLAFHPSGTVFTGGQGFYDASTAKQRARLPATLVSKGMWPAFDPTGHLLMTRHQVPEAAQLWDVRELTAPTLLGRFPIGRHVRGEPRAHFSQDGRALVFGDWDETVVVDLGALPEVRGHDDAPPVRSAWRTRFSPAGTAVVFDHEDGLSFWDLPRGALRRFVAVDRPLGFFAGGSRVLVRRGDALCALDTEDGDEVWRIARPCDGQDEVHAADDDGVLLYHERDRDGVVLALDMRDGRVRYQLWGQSVLLHDRDVFVTRSADGETALREVATGAVRVTLPGLAGGLFAISPDHRWLAAHDHRTELWDLTTGARAHELDSTTYSFRFRDDSAALIATTCQSPQSGNTDTITEEVFDVTTGARIGGDRWDESGLGDHTPPQEIAPGIVKDAGTLRVGERALALPADAVVCRTPGGEIFVAGRSPGRRVELYALRRSE
jgi:WD40 repeat protein